MPLALLALVPDPRPSALALALFLLGEATRLWAVGHIGRRSRTRGNDVGALVSTGPYSSLRNPLYVGNLLVWAAIGVVAWPLALLFVPLVAVHYAVIVRWEERNLLDQIGPAYADYMRRVPRWLPAAWPRGGSWDAREAFRSERGTLLVIAVAGALLCFRWYLST